MGMYAVTVRVLSRRRFTPSVNAVTLMDLSFCYVILMNECCLKIFVPFYQIKYGGATYARVRLKLE